MRLEYEDVVELHVSGLGEARGLHLKPCRLERSLKETLKAIGAVHIFLKLVEANASKRQQKTDLRRNLLPVLSGAITPLEGSGQKSSL
ncbi:hypothetical protein SRHO_G00116320 [Serrasalmus rhombeus]